MSGFPPASWKYRAGAAAIFFAHCLLLALYFGGARAIVSNEPLIKLDHGWHFYYCVLGSRFLREHGSTWGYDPFLMAGYPSGIIDMSDHSVKAAMAFLPFLSPEAAYKICVFIIGAVTPWLFLASALAWGLEKRLALIAMGLGSWLWWLCGGLIFFGTGMFGFPLASIYGLWLAGLFHQYLKTPTPGSSARLFLAAPLGLLIHPGILPIVGLPALVTYLLRLRELRLRRHLFILLIVLATLAANSFWILPFFANKVFSTGLRIYLQNPLELIPFIFLPSLAWGQIMVMVLPFAAIAGFRALLREGRRDLVYPLLAGAIVFLLFSLLGSQSPTLSQSQPTRYAMPLVFLLVLPAAKGMAMWASALRDPRSSRARRSFFQALFAILALTLLAFLILQARLRVEPPLVGLHPKLQERRDWIISHTDQSARVMLEDTGPFNNLYYNSYGAAPLAYYTHREIIGGPHWAFYIKNHIADLSGFVLFGKGLAQWDDPSLRSALARYNVGWVGVGSPIMKKFFDADPALMKPLAEAGDFKFYEVEQPRNFFLEGSGRVTSDYNRLVLSNVKTTTGRVVISYHWHPWFRAVPPAKVERVMIGDDQVGFLGVVNPPSELVLEIKYW